MNKNPESLKALDENNLEKVAGGGTRTTITYDDGTLVQTEQVCDRCGRVTDKLRYSNSPHYSELCDECFRSMQDDYLY